MKNFTQLLSILRNWLRLQLLFWKTLVFIWGLILSFALVSSGVVYFYSDYLSFYFHDKLRIAVIVGNLQEGLSSIFVIATHISKSYVSGFDVIIFCTGASIIGMMLLWMTDFPSTPHVIIYMSLIPIALGDAQRSTLSDFLKYQLKQSKNQSTDHTSNGNISACIWWNSAWIPGYLMALFWLSPMYYWADHFMYGGLIMGAMYLWFYCGCFCYKFEKPSESPLFKIYRVFRAAWSKSRLKCSGLEGYYWKNIIEKDLYLHHERASQIGLKPHVPLFWRCLDKAAIIKDEPSDANILGRQEINGELCPVEEVRDVKLVMSLTHFGLTLLPYSLVKNAEATFFVMQTDNMKHSEYILAIALFKSFTRLLMQKLCRWLNLTQQKITVVRIGLGMFCAVVCCFVAFLVENERRDVVRKEGILENPDKEISISIAILIPQYFLLGLAAGLAEDGFEVLFRNHVSQSMSVSVELFMEFVFLLGSILTVLFIYLITPWFKNSLNTSHLDKYYLMIAILNIGALLLYGYFSWDFIYNGGYTEDEIHGISEGVHQNDQEEVRTSAQSSTIQGDSDPATAGTSITVASEEQPRSTALQQNPGIRLVSRNSSLVRREQQ